MSSVRVEQRISIYGNGGGSPEMKPRWRWRRERRTVDALTLDPWTTTCPQDRWELVTSTEGHLNSQFEKRDGRQKHHRQYRTGACTVRVPYTLLLPSY